MDKFIPKEKMSKKARREHDRNMRTIWGISPVTKLKENKKIYNRKKACRDVTAHGEPFLCLKDLCILKLKPAAFVDFSAFV